MDTLAMSQSELRALQRVQRLISTADAVELGSSNHSLGEKARGRPVFWVVSPKTKGRGEASFMLSGGWGWKDEAAAVSAARILEVERQC